MDDVLNPLLPYRADPDAIGRWAEARARGRTRAQLREGATASPKGAEGVAATAALLGFSDPAGELTELGREYALAPPERRRELIYRAVIGFRPYRELLEAVRARGDARTEAPWIEAWWATHAFGNSPSNRREGAAVLGRLVQFTGLGRYLPGRRGYATRIEWADRALSGLPEARGEEGGEGEPPLPTAPPEIEAATRDRAADLPGSDGGNRVEIALRDGRTARLQLPRRLPADEKRRLLELVDLLITEV